MLDVADAAAVAVAAAVVLGVAFSCHLDGGAYVLVVVGIAVAVATVAVIAGAANIAVAIADGTVVPIVTGLQLSIDRCRWLVWDGWCGVRARFSCSADVLCEFVLWFVYDA